MAILLSFFGSYPRIYTERAFSMFQCLPLIEERLGSNDTKIEIVASIHKQESVTSPISPITAAAATDTFDLATEDHTIGIRSAAVTAAAATRTTVTQTFVGNVTHIRCSNVTSYPIYTE